MKAKKIWIDLDNSPHVPFFKPIVRALEDRGYAVLITARDRFQVCELAERLNLRYRSVGSHYGKNKIVKMFWLTLRALQLIRIVFKKGPRLAVCHGSRSQIMAAKILRIPSVNLYDYEYAKGIPFFKPTWTIVPEIVYKSSVARNRRNRLLKYPGIKEDVYVLDSSPSHAVMDELKLDSNRIIVTIRPPATEAHYFNPESERLFEETMDFLCSKENIKLIILPRHEKQRTFIRQKWTTEFANGKIVIPEHAVDGLDLLQHSDLVISGGGTMNREAASLGVPVYSIFRGKIGVVDRYLSEKGRLVLIENKDQLYSKIVLAHRDKSFKPARSDNLALEQIVSHIVNIIEGRYS